MDEGGGTGEGEPLRKSLLEAPGGATAGGAGAGPGRAGGGGEGSGGCWAGCRGRVSGGGGWEVLGERRAFGSGGAVEPG